MAGYYPRRTDAHLFRPPGYAAFLAAATLGRPDRIALAKTANALVGALAAVLLAVLSSRVFRRRGVALATGGLAAVHPTFLLASADLQSEPLFLLLLCASGFVLLAAADRPSSNLALAAGGVLALAALTRSSALVLAPLLLAPLGDRRYPFRARAHIGLSALLGFVFALSPWVLRNALVFRELILVNDGAGYVFYGRNSDAAIGLAEARTRAEVESASAELERSREALIASLPPEVRASPGRLSRELFSAALRDRLSDPRPTNILLAWKARDWLRPWPDPRFWPRPAVVALGVLFGVLYLLAAAGLVRAERTGVRAFCLAFLALTFAFHLVFETSWRYRAAYWEPVLLLYAVPGAASLARRRSPATSPP